jgi:hypothetical protein
VFRAVVLALIVALSFEVSGLASVCGDPVEGEECSDGPCAPNCHACACCSIPKTIVSTPVVSLPAPPAVTATWRPVGEAPPSTDPADIFHVPKLLA